mmetsp:Transcript_15633/g.42113  ORF Transcript_15633/g.42113 Transcript_15633/m.42113 type:complete len:142 (-) Transcript_15633:1764-2189(-)
MTSSSKKRKLPRLLAVHDCGALAAAVKRSCRYMAPSRDYCAAENVEISVVCCILLRTLSRRLQTVTFYSEALQSTVDCLKTTIAAAISGNSANVVRSGLHCGLLFNPLQIAHFVSFCCTSRQDAAHRSESLQCAKYCRRML